MSFAGFLLLATLSLSLSKFDATLATVWLPNAAATAFLLYGRLRNEIPFYIGVFLASTIANALAGTTVPVSMMFSVANIVDIALVVWITRKGCGDRPDMSRLRDLARFTWAGGLIGPALSAAIAASAMGPDLEVMKAGALSWFLTDAVGMVLIVPTALLVAEALNRPIHLSGEELAERVALLGGGMACTFLVFNQSQYPLLFLIPPITLLHAFRLGSLGTGLYIGGLAALTTIMTWAGLGPIAGATGDPRVQLLLVQALLAANILVGLPVSAILTGRDAMMREVERNRQRLNLLADNITDAVLRFDLDGICTYASPSTHTVLGAGPETFLGHKSSDRMHPEAREEILGASARLLGGKSSKERFTYRRFIDDEDGNPVFIEADCAIVHHPQTGERHGIVVSARDVTDRVELELLLTRARRQAENAAEAKSQFLANMSHEIRTPMNGVLGFAELLLQSELDPDQQRQASMIVQSGRSMMMLLNDILDLSKIEAGQISIDPEPIDLHAALEDCVMLHDPNARKKGVAINFGRIGAEENEGEPEDGETWVLADALRLRQIVLNLIGNAVKFTHSGQIDVRYGVGEEDIIIEVEDSGVGIHPSLLDSIFTPFTQGESDTARRYGGTGLGLSISRQLAELLGGLISVTSELGVGSCFTLTVPAERAEPVRDRIDSRPAPRPADLPRDAHILLVEDHDVNRMLVVEMLEQCGQSVALAHDGNEAIAMVMNSILRGTPYDLVLMDIQMPGCDGYAATRAIRAEGIGPETLPIIALTANAFPEDISATRKAGMQGHLGKPIAFADLVRALQRWLPTQIIDSHGDDAETKPASIAHMPSSVSPSTALAERWRERRGDAIEAVRAAFQSGALGEGMICEDSRRSLARLMHKLAGSAGMFGEDDLGEQAAALERALKMRSRGEVQEMLAADLLDLADNPPGEPKRMSGT